MTSMTLNDISDHHLQIHLSLDRSYFNFILEKEKVIPIKSRLIELIERIKNNAHEDDGDITINTKDYNFSICPSVDSISFVSSYYSMMYNLETEELLKLCQFILQ